VTLSWEFSAQILIQACQISTMKTGVDLLGVNFLWFRGQSAWTVMSEQRELSRGIEMLQKDIQQFSGCTVSYQNRIFPSERPIPFTRLSSVLGSF
jgi:hypothetical protein